MSVKARQLGYFERWSLTRARLKIPPIIVFLATLPSAEITLARVEAACQHLLNRHAALRCAIDDISTRQPRLAARDITGRDVAFLDQTPSAALPTEQLLQRFLVDGLSFLLEKGPLWKVVLLLPSQGEPLPRVALLIEHVLADGTGARNLFAELLSLLHNLPTSSSPVSSALPPSLEATVDTRPSYRTLLSVVWNELLSPRLPAIIRPAPAAPCWPNIAASQGDVSKQPSLVKLLTLPVETVTAIRAAGKTSGLSVQTLLHSSTMAALVRTCGEDQPVRLVGTTPVSLRSEAAGHPNGTGNYVGVYDKDETLSLSSPFISLCRSYATGIVSPAERKKIQAGVGMLAYIPDPVNGPDTDKTGFEMFLAEKVKNGCQQSFEVSNLMVLPETGWEQHGSDFKVLWTQAGSCTGPALTISVSVGSDSRP